VSRKHEECFRQGKEQAEDDHESHFEHHLHTALQKEQGRESNHGSKHRCSYRGQHFHGALYCSPLRALTTFIMGINILSYYDPVIHQDTNHQDHPKEGDHIYGDAIDGGNDKHGQERCRYPPGHPER